MRVPRPSRTLRRAGTTNARATDFVRKNRAASAASPPTPSTSSGQALAKNARMGHPQWERCTQEPLRVGPPAPLRELCI